MQLKKRLLQASVLLALTGCAQLGIVRTAVDVQAEQLADQVRDSAEHVTCKGITVGAYQRKYGRDPKLAAAWRVYCGYDSVLTMP